MKLYNNETKCEFSFIIATRNDNHGGNMKEKNQFFSNRWINYISELETKKNNVFIKNKRNEM
jgi:hypothetical protein